MTTYETKEIFAKNLSSLLAEHNETQAMLAEVLGVAASSVSGWCGGVKMPRMPKIEQIAAHFGVPRSRLLEDQPSPLPSPRIATDVVSFPIITSVAAHYDSMSFNESGVEGDSVEIPEKYLRGRPASDYCVMRVKGDSMYPDFRDGDLVLVLLQATLNRPRDIGVIAYGDDEMTIKRIDYVMGEDWLELIPINPTYPPKRIENAELERCRVIGIPKLLIREL